MCTVTVKYHCRRSPIRNLLAVLGRDRRRQFVGLDDLALPLHLAVGLQVSDVAPGSPEPILLAVDVVEDLGAGEVAVEGEVAGDLPLADPVDQLAAQGGMIEERLLRASQISCLRKRRNSRG